MSLQILLVILIPGYFLIRRVVRSISWSTFLGRRLVSGSTDFEPEVAAAAGLELAFEDGSIVLLAESTLFRVHKSILSRHSEFFEDTFTLPQPRSSNEPNVNGCSVIRFPETADKVGHMLEALYNASYVNKRTVPFAYVSSLLEMGTKYLFADLRREAVLRLQGAYPWSCYEYLNVNKESSTNPRTIKPEEFECIRVYHLANAHMNHDEDYPKTLRHISAVAMYMCCQIEPHRLQVARQVGIHLGEDFLIRHATGRKNLQTEKSNRIAKSFFTSERVPNPECTGGNRCLSISKSLLREAHASGYLHSVDVIRCASSDPLFQKLRMQSCSDCGRFYGDQYMSAVEVVWKGLEAMCTK